MLHKVGTVGEKTTKLTRTKVENDWLGHLLKSPTFVVAAPKNWEEFCLKSIGVIRCSVTKS